VIEDPRIYKENKAPLDHASNQDKKCNFSFDFRFFTGRPGNLIIRPPRSCINSTNRRNFITMTAAEAQSTGCIVRLYSIGINERFKLEGGKTMNCPICNIPLNVSERQGVEIDHCSKCRGVWLDRGELDKIIERSTAQMPSRPYPERQDDRHDQHYDKHRDENYGGDHHKKKRGFLHDLFD
jgi:Zn-finger nucleic acid-binding protein